ncbi:hypothetical protein [Candidatus Magnetomonas plexicatena]|uniref:hypothetical protein n=1 Tax=Candidatus Magnetomonas plexicatena TaxID=2552947 RepID=UPI001102A08C|nr:hypothetical protein E2O03_003455 [Nitrospirales bacterium LBB_01]
MKRSLVYVLLLALVLTGMGIYGAAKVDAGTYVKYFIPYLSTNTNGVTYCVLSNMGGMFDNVSRTVVQVTGNAAGNASQAVITHDDPAAYNNMTFRSTNQLTFSGQYVYIGTGNTQIFTLTSDTSTASGLQNYGLTLSMVAASTTVNVNAGSAAGIARSSMLDCKKMSMSCFQGTTSPKRNMIGYTCESGMYDGTTYRVYKVDSWTSTFLNGGNFITNTYAVSGTDNSTDLAY